MSTVHWIWLQETLGAGSNKLQALLSRFDGPEGVFGADEESLRRIGCLRDGDVQKLLRRDLARAEKIMETCRRRGYGILTPADASYPKRLLRIFNPPLALYLRGELPDIDEEVAITVVGPRRATEGGVQAAYRMAGALARAGCLLVSGGAMGIDGAAHKGALDAGGKTIAVLGGGLDHPYPKGNAELRKEIAGHGCLLSEYPPGSEPLAFHFPVRNRILAGLSLGVVVVEAGERSGALLTAGHALDQGKDIFVMPGDVGSPQHVGSNRLLRDGAIPLLSPLDILEEYAAGYPHKLDVRSAMEAENREKEKLHSTADVPPKPTKSPAAPAKTRAAKSAGARQSSASAKASEPAGATVLPADLSHEARQLYERMPADICGFDRLAMSSGLSPELAMRCLTELELNGVLEALPGGRYKKV